MPIKPPGSPTTSLAPAGYGGDTSQPQPWVAWKHPPGQKKNGSPHIPGATPIMYQPLTEASPGNGAVPCLTQTTTIRGATDAKPIYYHAPQVEGLEASPLYKGLGLVLFLVGAGILGIVYALLSATYKVLEKPKTTP